jgi:hypothetical protein
MSKISRDVKKAMSTHIPTRRRGKVIVGGGRDIVENDDSGDVDLLK